MNYPLSHANPKSQQGVALIVVLLIVAIVSIIATEMTGRLQLNIKKASALKDSNQAYWFAVGAEQLAMKGIAQQINADNDVIHLEQPWATTEINYPIPGGSIEGELVDMRTCFNLNALAEKPEGNNPFPQKAVFEALIEIILSDVPSLDRDILVGTLIDWLDADQQIENYGAEDSDYEALPFPYLAANTTMANTSELRLLNNMRADLMEKLLPHVCTLPDSKDLIINVNTITEDQAPLLSAMLGSGVNQSTASNIIANRPPDGYSDINQFLSISEVSSAQLTAEQKKGFDITTRYFSLNTKTQYNKTSFKMTTLFKIEKDKPVVVARREFGGIK